ncbi:glycosyltransferase family 4 protein [Arthrobacter sp. ISL-85]|uniref:glycosyltransferase family 4 protein n=1 Tax=Arthrobacter sp. ISL-85 TaxID=2819115 RepID=UPI001BE7BB29|nr:glycosyltransferase family 4 protein [Arthrobacter sp. ISL-85]MBT2568955.1 glycosyltransferase family 4 protein [Arthrobacter sp. ISL-85]
MTVDADLQRSPRNIRIRPELRATQVQEAHEMVPAITLYFSEKYDLGNTVLDASFRKVNLLQALKFIVLSKAKILEVPEPLWVRFLPKNLVILTVWRLSRLFKDRSRLAVTYAIENNDLGRLLTPKLKLPPFALRFAGAFLGVVINTLIDRIAFGSAGSSALYNSLMRTSSVSQCLFEEIPAPSEFVSETATPRAIFIGELDDRKGINHVMDAWPHVEETVKGATLTIIGGGPYSERVSNWCNQRPDTRIYLGFLPHQEVNQHLRECGVLVAPSRRSGRWREQIGLPIAEGLSHGLTIVTTDESGLASWLAANGHTVIKEAQVECELADALSSALREPLTPFAVTKSLPPVPGRIQADRWLHR